MKKLLFAMLLLLLLSPSFSSVCLYYFHGDGCPHCAKVNPFIDEISNMSNVDVHSFEIYHNESNFNLLNKMYDKYNVDGSYRGIPVVFIGNKVIIGDDDIKNNLLDEINRYEDLPCPDAESSNVSYSTNSTSLSFFIAITTAALLDSINPCAIAVLLVLLGSIHLASNDRKRVVMSGFMFIIGVYIVYFLFGLGLLSAIKLSGLSNLFYTFVGLLAILVGIFNIKDYIKWGSFGFVMEIPLSWRPKIKSMMEKVSSPIGALFMGFTVCFFELPCTGGPYFFALGLLSKNIPYLTVILSLLYYNLLFVLPLVIINVLFYFYGKRFLSKTKKLKDKNKSYIHLITGLLMILLGLLVILGWI